MHSIKLLSAAILALGASTVSAATCTKDIKITEPTQSVDCDVVKADITLDSDLSGDVVINGPKQITGSITGTNASSILSLKSTTISSISGSFSLETLDKLNTIEFSSLRSVGEITLIKLPQLSTLNFGTEGVTKISKIRISDTFISDLSGLSVASVENFQIDNNRQITKFESDLVNITGTLQINNNGNALKITMNKLQTAGEFQISNITSFDVPLLQSMNMSMYFDANSDMETFYAPNLTKISSALSFVNNKKLTNISMPALQTIGGGFVIQNNTALKKINGFEDLQTAADISFRGNFTEVDLPALKQVSGTAMITSTDDISSFCSGDFSKLKSSGVIKGKNSNCTSNNAKANEGGNGGNSSSSSSSSTKEDGAGMTGVSFTIFGLTAVAALAQLF